MTGAAEPHVATAAAAKCSRWSAPARRFPLLEGGVDTLDHVFVELRNPPLRGAASGQRLHHEAVGTCATPMPGLAEVADRNHPSRGTFIRRARDSAVSRSETCAGR